MIQSELLPETGQPVGIKVDTTPAKRPGPVTLQGRYGRIEKLEPPDNVIFSVIDSEWPARKAAFECWLSPDNFDAGGEQRASLSKLNGAAA